MGDDMRWLFLRRTISFSAVFLIILVVIFLIFMVWLSFGQSAPYNGSWEGFV